jgi:hypothetical protein
MPIFCEQHAAETAKFAATVHNMDVQAAAAAIAAREFATTQFRQLGPS